MASHTTRYRSVRSRFGLVMPCPKLRMALAAWRHFAGHRDLLARLHLATLGDLGMEAIESVALVGEDAGAGVDAVRALHAANLSSTNFWRSDAPGVNLLPVEMWTCQFASTAAELMQWCSALSWSPAMWAASALPDR